MSPAADLFHSGQMHHQSVESLLPNPDYRDDNITIFSDISVLPEKFRAVRLEAFALLLCVEGMMDVDINGRIQPVVKGECLIGQPGDIVANCKMAEGFRGEFFIISPEIISECIAGNERWSRAFRLKANPIVAIPHEKLPVYELYGKILLNKSSLTGTHDPYARRSMISIVRAALLDLTADMGEDETSDGNGVMRQPDILFRRFVDLLKGKRIKPRVVSWYAERLCVTPKYLSAVCKTVSGHTAYDWIRRATLEDICHALKYSNRSIKEIAVELGFTNMSFFGKFVKSAYNISPKELRAKLRAENEGIFSTNSW